MPEGAEDQDQPSSTGLQFPRCGRLMPWESSQAALTTHSFGFAGPESVNRLACLLKRIASRQPALVSGPFLLQQFPLCSASHRNKPLTFLVLGVASNSSRKLTIPPPMTS